MRAAFGSINGCILRIPTVALIALIVVGLAAVRTIGTITRTEHQARARTVVEAATTIVKAFYVLIPTMPETRLRPLMRRFSQMLQDQPVCADAFGPV
jgi:hypothetical protein